MHACIIILCMQSLVFLSRPLISRLVYLFPELQMACLYRDGYFHNTFVKVSDPVLHSGLFLYFGLPFSWLWMPCSGGSKEKNRNTSEEKFHSFIGQVRISCSRFE